MIRNMETQGCRCNGQPITTRLRYCCCSRSNEGWTYDFRPVGSSIIYRQRRCYANSSILQVLRVSNHVTPGTAVHLFIASEHCVPETTHSSMNTPPPSVCAVTSSCRKEVSYTRSIEVFPTAVNYKLYILLFILRMHNTPILLLEDSSIRSRCYLP